MPAGQWLCFIHLCIPGTLAEDTLWDSQIVHCWKHRAIEGFLVGD